jgi:hypothetical protein
MLLRKPTTVPRTSTAPPIVNEVLQCGGAPLPPDVRERLEDRLGHDFGQVRVHTDDRSADSARAVGAVAYTVGDHIVFGSGRYSPVTAAGRGLLAHELVHVIQQRSSQPAVNGSLAVGDPQTPAEAEAEREEVRAADEQMEAEPTFRQGRPHVTRIHVGSTPSPSTLIQRRVSPDMNRIRHRLTYRALDWAITEQEVREVLQFLRSLSDADLRDTVAAMDAEGLLDRMYDNIAGSDWNKESATLQRIRLARTWTIATTSGGTTVTTTVRGSCSPERFQQISRAATQGLTWLDRAAAHIDAYVSAPRNPANGPTAQALILHFKSVDPRVVQHIRGRIQRIRSDIASAVPFSIECHDRSDPSCRGSAGAYVDNPNRVVFCGEYFGSSGTSERYRIETLVHEMAHAQVGGLHITDRAYEGERLYRRLTTEQALTNAESYGLLVEQLATGRLPKPPPRDTFQDCGGWEEPLRAALAVALRWNRNAQTVLTTLTSADAQRWKPEPQRLLGGTNQASIDAARAAFDELDRTRSETVDFECEQTGGGRCNESVTYWYATGDLHICPSWARRNADEQAVALLAGLYGYRRIVDENARRWNYARLGRSLTAEHFAVPTLAQIVGSQAWSPDALRIQLQRVRPPTGRPVYEESGSLHMRISQDLPVLRSPRGLGFFACRVIFAVDNRGSGRPLPFTPPRLNAEFRVPRLGAEMVWRREDTRPEYSGPGVALRSSIPDEMSFRPSGSGRLRMRIQLQDPDARTTRVYEDTIQVVEEPAPSPGDFPMPPTQPTRALA